MRFACHLSRSDGQWTLEHASKDLRPIRVTASTREEAVRRMEGEIRYQLEMCPCSGATMSRIEVVIDTDE